MPASIAYDSLVLGKLVERHARYRPRHTALIAPCGSRDVRLNWRDLDAYVNRYAQMLAALGVARGDRVASVLANSLELVTLYYACAKLGAAAVPLSTLLNASGLATLLADAAPRVVVASAAQRAVLDAVRRQAQDDVVWLLVDASAEDESDGYRCFASLHAASSTQAPAADVRADDLLTLMYTSGTTGLPKGIPHTHFIRAMYATTMANAWRMQPSSVVLHSGAIVFNGAMTTLLPALMLGATYVVHRQFDPERFMATVESERVTHTMLVPSQIIAILDAPTFDPARLTSLEMMLSLGAPLHVEYKERLDRVLPERFYELYGLTEGFITVLDRDAARRKAGSVGVPPPFYELRILDPDGNELPVGEVGEIVGRGPITMPGYYHRDDLTAATLRDGWLRTGDLGYVDDEGYRYLVDRMKDMIDSGGVKIYPRDIEEVAARHPAIREVAVFGVPHDKWGETPVAAVILKAGKVESPESLCDWINGQVAARYQRLDRVVLLDDFPRNAAGKTLKRELRAPFWTRP
jgi:long-chain acyl-CoA synthetase